MVTSLRFAKNRLVALAVVAALALGAVIVAPQPAEARAVFVFGLGVPVFPPAYYPPAYYPPNYYYPPPVVYAPPPPPVVYAPEPAVSASPASAPYRAPNGQTCREYRSTAIVNGVQQPVYGTACLQPDGTWRIVN